MEPAAKRIKKQNIIPIPDEALTESHTIVILKTIPRLESKLCAQLKNHDFRGNFTELENKQAKFFYDLLKDNSNPSFTIPPDIYATEISYARLVGWFYDNWKKNKYRRDLVKCAHAHKHKYQSFSNIHKRSRYLDPNDMIKFTDDIKIWALYPVMIVSGHSRPK